jgi:hypothetical protein
MKGFAESPVTGKGAGTYEFTWDRHRTVALLIVDAHSLYLETMTELGVVGLLLLAATIIAILVRLARRARGPNRIVYAALFCAALAWAVHAGVDWDWEMPVVTAWIFAVGGAALAATAPVRHPPLVGSRNRVPLAVALLVTALTPVLLLISQDRLETAASAFEQNNCTRASSAAISTINVLAIRPEPYQILGYCDLAAGRAQDAVAAMRKAVHYESVNWEYHWGLAIAEGYAGIDPRPEVATAARMNPQEALVSQALPAFRAASAAGWLSAAKTAYASTVRNTDQLTLR